MAEAKKKCFVIAPIGDEGSETREHSDTVLECLINPVLKPLGFADAERADHIGEPGVITRQIVDRIVKDDLVIADLTGRNPNVYYELAIRHASGKPFIQMIKKGENIPFDVGQQRTIPFDPQNLRDAEKVKAILRKQVEACLRPDFKMESPVHYNFDFQGLKSTGGATERSMTLILEQLDYLVSRERVRDEQKEARRLRQIQEDAVQASRKKKKGQEPAQIIDLFEALKKSLEDVQAKEGPFKLPPKDPPPEPA